jgi:two-component system, NtrC family, sensor kinase
MLEFFSLAGLVNGLSAALLGLFVFSRQPTDVRHRTYAAFCLCLTLWSYAYFRWLISDNAADALWWSRALMAGAIFIPPTAFHHLVRLLDKKIPSWFIPANYLISALIFGANGGDWVVVGVAPQGRFAFWPVPGPLFHLHVAQLAGLALLGLALLYRELGRADGLRRNQIKFLIFAEIVGWSGGATNYPLWYGIPILPFGNILVSLYTAIFAYAMVRYRLLDIEVVIKKSLIYTFQLLILLIPCYLVLLAAQLTFFDAVSRSFSFVALALFIVVGFLFPKIRFRTEEAFERVLFKKGHDYRATLLHSSREMVSMVDLEAVSENLVKTVVKALGVAKASLFLFDESSGLFKVRSAVGVEASEMPELARAEPLVEIFMRMHEAIVREELEMASGRHGGSGAAATMRRLEAEIALPLNSKDRLIGILNLGHREGKEMYSQEDIEVLSTLANQAAIAIENARLYENLKLSQSIIRRADRLSSLGMLTAGLAHEIRNPLVAIRTFTQLLPERYQDEEFRDGFKTLALKEVDRICGLVNDLLNFARPSTPNVSAQDVNEIVDSIARILETEAKEKGVKIEIHLASGLPKIFIDKEQIKQVCMNLILNAIQSIEEPGSVEIGTRLFGENGSKRFAQIEVRDTGVGIPQKDIENIFNPFFTTKKDGSGLGLSISHQIIKEHGGYIVVESQVGRGTCFFVRLPVGYFPAKELKPGPQVHEKDPGS